MIPFNLTIEKVFAIQDGILIEARYNEDMIYYRNSEPSSQVKTQEREALAFTKGGVKNIDHLMEETPTFSRYSADSMHFEVN